MSSFVIRLAAFLASIPAAMAHCPLCTAATGAAVGVARFYGVDDAMVGALIGGFVVSSALWANNAFNRRNWIFMHWQGAAFVLLSLVLTIIGFSTGGLFSTNGMDVFLFGLPRLLSGMLLGTMAVVSGHFVHEYLRHTNNGKNILPYQGLSIMLASLLLISAVFAGGLL